MNISINTFEQLYKACLSQNKPIHEIAQMNMSCETGISEKEIRSFTLKSLIAMKESVRAGLSSNELSMSKMCGNDCDKLQNWYKVTPSVFGKIYEKITAYALAVSEENIRMGKIVACPTAGSCGILPSVLVAFGEEFNFSEDDLLNALITAGEIGRIVSLRVALAGAVAGCQAECGVAAAMSASAACQLRGGDVSQVINAGALALKNILGLTCDPVAGLVEVPCVKRNVFLAVHAVTACELALSGITSVIPFDEVVDAMSQTGALMSPMLKESSEAGLATTKTAIKIKNTVFPE